MITEILVRVFWSMCISLGFAVLFNTPSRALWAVAMLSAIGFGIKEVLLHVLIPGQIVFAALAGATSVGILSYYFAHRVHTPPIVFSIPAVISMIPGVLGYNFMIGLIKIMSVKSGEIIDFAVISDIINQGVKAISILLALAFGIIFPVVILNTSTAKGKDPHRLLQKTFVHKTHKKKDYLPE